MQNLKTVLSFDDVILVPQYSSITSRREINTSQTFVVNNKLNVDFEIPIISSPMSTVTQDYMANAMNSHGGLGIIHRYNTIEQQCETLSKIDSPTRRSAAIGASGDYKERCAELVRNGMTVVCIDVAHGDHVLVEEAVSHIKKTYPDLVVIAGNVATGSAYKRLSRLGVDFVRTSVGSGSICTTRIQTGHGIPTFQAVYDCNQARAEMISVSEDSAPAFIVADGGIKNAGDIAKSLAVGADLVMLGSMLSGTKETPGRIHHVDGKKYKSYNGMASKVAQKAWKGSYSSIEGVGSRVLYKGTVSKVINEIMSNVRSAMSYSGAYDLYEFRENAEFVRQTVNSHAEGTAHIRRNQ